MLEDVFQLLPATLALGGVIRTYPRDFIVEEVWNKNICTTKYSSLNRARDYLVMTLTKQNEYTHFTLIKNDWETIRALNRLRRPLKISLKRLGLSGMKDKRAVTAQRVSVWKVDIKRLMRLKIKDIILKDFQYANTRITLGDASGNRFTIIIRNITTPRQKIKAILSGFKFQIASKGIPNLYGSQRLGGNNAAVGKAIKDGVLKEAVELILEKIQPQLRTQSIDAIPKVFWYEKRMVRHLQQFSNDYAGAMRKIPKKVLRLYVHAYQSQLFNEQVKQGIKNSDLPDYISIDGFTTPKMPELSTKSITRQTLLTCQDFQILHIHDGTAKIRFTLSRGQYASTVLSYLNTKSFRRSPIFGSSEKSKSP